MSYLEDLMEMPVGSLEVGTVTVEGTPEGFRALAGVLMKMADTVKSGKAKGKGWGLVLHPEDVKGLMVREVESLSLGCRD